MSSLLEGITGMLVDDVSSLNAVVVDTISESVELGMMSTVDVTRISTDVDVALIMDPGADCREVLGVTLDSGGLKGVVDTTSTVVGIVSSIVTVLGSNGTLLLLSGGSVGVVISSVVVGIVPIVVTASVVAWVGASVTGIGTE